MKTTNQFKGVIKDYLEQTAKENQLFAKSFQKKDKNIDDCIIYILNQVQESGCQGFTDAEIFGMAMHYYDEDNLEVGKPIQANIIINRKVEISAPSKSISSSKKPKQDQKIKKEDNSYSFDQLSMF
jgi:hypothetical protein